MKGKTIIQLKDVKTGAVQTVEHGNTFQSAVLSDLFKQYGNFRMSLLNGTLYDDASQFWKDLVGGLLLFDGEIEVGSYYPPASVGMVGNASYNVLNSGIPNELGSWNESESYVSKDEIVMTYDFSTAQANGSIASVALTSSLGGLVGVGNPSMERKSDWNNRDIFLNRITRNSPESNNYGIWDGDYYYSITIVGTKAHVKKIWANTSGIDLISNYESAEFAEEYDLEIGRTPDSRAGSFSVNGNVLIYYEVSSGTNITVVEMNVVTKVVRTDNFVAPFTVGAMHGVAGAETTQIAVQYDDSGSRRCSIYDVNNSEWVEDFEMPNTTNWIWGIWQQNDRYYFGINATSTPAYSVLNGASLPLNGRNFYTFETNFYRDRNMIALYRAIDISRPSNYLATINNLDEPVVKDNTKTMKVIYVLSRR